MPRGREGVGAAGAAGLCAAHGAIAWLTFGLLEHLGLSVLPAWRESSLLLAPSSRVVALAATLAAYAAGGVLIGGAAGAVAWIAGWRPSERDAAGRMMPDLATATLVAVFIPHLVAARGFSRSAYLSLVVGAVIAAVIAGRLVSRSARFERATGWIATPLAVSACLLAPLVFRSQLHLSMLGERVGPSAGALKAAVSAGGTLALVLLLVAGAMLRRGTTRTPFRPRLVAVAAIALAMIASSVVLDRRATGRLAEGRPAARGGPEVTGVLLLTLDAVRADHLSAYGYAHETSPSLAALARHATLYLHARAASDMSLGTHASLFTGKYPSRHGAWAGGDFPIGRPLPASERTLAGRTAEAGCVRFAAVANGYFLNTAYGLSRGFQVFDVPSSDRLELRWRIGAVSRRFEGRPTAIHRAARELNAVLGKGFEVARDAGRPFFAFANYMEAHDPYAPGPSFLGRFPGYDPSLPARAGRFIGPEGARRVVDPRERRHLVSLYDAAIASLDRELGLLFDRMRALGVYDGALIVVTADHGEMLGEHGVFGHGAGLVEEVLRIPLIVKYPFQAEGRRVSVPVSQVDVVPTVLDVLGLPAAAGVDGISLRDAERAGDRVLLSESPPHRLVYRGGATVVERVPDGSLPAQPDPATLDRLKSLGYVR